MVRIDQLPPPRGPADATPEGISDYMQYAAHELARAPEQFPTPEDIKTLAEGESWQANVIDVVHVPCLCL